MLANNKFTSKENIVERLLATNNHIEVLNQYEVETVMEGLYDYGSKCFEVNVGDVSERMASMVLEKLVVLCNYNSISEDYALNRLKCKSRDIIKTATLSYDNINIGKTIFKSDDRCKKVYSKVMYSILECCLLKVKSMVKGDLPFNSEVNNFIRFIDLTIYSSYKDEFDDEFFEALTLLKEISTLDYNCIFNKIQDNLLSI